MDAARSRRHGQGRAGPLGLVWINPQPVERPDAPRADLRVVPPSAVPPRPVKLDLAIERQLTGADGLNRDEFLVLFSGRGFGAAT